MALTPSLPWSAQRDKLCPDCILCPGCTACQTFGLTAREAVIIRQICEGLSNREMARTLGITENTVKRHITNIMNKTGDDNRTSVALRAIRTGFVKLAPPDLLTKEQLRKRLNDER